MRNAYFIVGLACLTLGACANKTPDAVIIDSGARAPDPCPASAIAPVQARPADPATEAEREKVVEGVVSALPEARAVAILEYDGVTIPGWGQRGWNRVTEIQKWCAGRR